MKVGGFKLIKQYMKLIVIVSIMMLFLTSHLKAGITGKISGIVLNAQNDEPIIGATVRVLGTNIVTQTDSDGEYFILNIPSGKYDVSITSVGFETVTKLEVRILVDLTTPVDFEVNEKTVEISTNVEVFAQNPIIQKDLTASKIIFTSDRLQQLPNIISVQSVLTNYPGVVIGRDDDLHVRGGRSGQVSYYFDGFSIQDPFVSSSGIRIMPNALEELSLTSGGYTSEYGEALSGVVSAVTREGGAEYKGSIKLYEGMTHAYNVESGEWANLNRNGNKSGSVLFSGPLPYLNKHANNFSLAGEYLHDPTSLPHNGIASYTGTAKFSLQPTSSLKLISNMTYYTAEGEFYNHRDVNNVSYDMNLDGLPRFEKEAYLLGLSGNYFMNKKMILSTRFNHFYTSTKRAPEHLFDNYWSDWDGYSEDSNGVYDGTIQENNYGNIFGDNYDQSNPINLVGFTTGADFDPTYRFRESKYNALHMSLVDQIDKNHQLKTGFEYRAYDIHWDFKQFYNSKPFGEKYHSEPLYFSMFLQDKIEYDFYVINLGLRYAYRKDNISYRVIDLSKDSTSVYKDAESNSNISPRVGVSFPLSDRSVMHFNYGIYYQVPQFTYMYTNLQGDTTSGLPLLGNPNLKPERTTSYELGFNHLLTNEYRIDVTAYQKDINDLVTTRSLNQAGSKGGPQTIITTFVNEDYGSAKGLDVQFEKLPGHGLLSASISYGYMVANGNGSNAFEPYYGYITSQNDTIAPVSEFPLDFDQRHTITAVLDFRVPENYKSKLFGVQIPTDWGVGFVGNYGSGLPYTITDKFRNRIGDRNEGRLPANYTVDMKFLKHFKFNKNNYKLSFFVEIDNLFDTRNVIDVYTNTGRPDEDGINPTALLSLGMNQTDVDRLDGLYDKNPTHYSRPRTVRTGLEFNF